MRHAAFLAAAVACVAPAPAATAAAAATAATAAIDGPAAAAADAGAAPADDGMTAASAAAEVAAIVRTILAPAFVADWRGVEAVGSVEWASLPPKALRDCLPDGGCFVRQGSAYLAGRPFGVLASGARGVVSHVHLRNAGEPLGEAAVLAALRRAGLVPEPARCAAGADAAGASRYRISGAGSGMVSIQTSCNGRPCEGYVVSPGREPRPGRPAPDGRPCGAPAAGGGRAPAAPMPR